MSGSGPAFVRGGFGCIAAFILVGIAVVATGGRAHVDCGGLILLFLIGGVIGLVVHAVRGSRTPAVPPPPERPPGPWACASCGAMNAEAMNGCVACGELRP